MSPALCHNRGPVQTAPGGSAHGESRQELRGRRRARSGCSVPWLPLWVVTVGLQTVSLHPRPLQGSPLYTTLASVGPQLLHSWPLYSSCVGCHNRGPCTGGLQPQKSIVSRSRGCKSGARRLLSTGPPLLPLLLVSYWIQCPALVASF